MGMLNGLTGNGELRQKPNDFGNRNQSSTNDGFIYREPDNDSGWLHTKAWTAGERDGEVGSIKDKGG